MNNKRIFMLTATFSLFSVTSYADLGEGYLWINDKSLLSCSNADSNFERIYDYKYEKNGWQCNGNCQAGPPECASGKNASMDGMVKIFPFDKIGEGGWLSDRDAMVFYAIPRDGGKELLEKGEIKVWSENNKNNNHIVKYKGLNGFYECSSDADICYIALITKDSDVLDYDADQVYLIFPENILTGWTERHSKHNPDPPTFGNFTCDKVAVLESKIGSYGGQCVPYVRKEAGIEYECCHGDAKNCSDQAAACGYDVDNTPERGAIAVFNSWNGNPYGHVGIVIGIDSKNGRIQLRHSNWRLDERVSENWVSTKNIKGYIHAQGEGCTGSGGMTQPDPTEPPASGKLPDFITSKVTMGNKDGKHEKYTWKINETAYVHDYIDNIGTADWEGKAKKIKVPFYLSKGTKEDSHSEWVRVSRQEIKREHLKVKDKPKHEYIKFNLAEWANDSTVLPGRTYNFVVCADRPKDENNGDGDVKEKHKSNNCSTEAVFYVDFGPARNVDLIADNLALTGGRTELQAGEKYGLQVEVSNIGTEQPWNGFRTKYEIKGPGTGGVWQKIGDEHSKASSLYARAIHFESMTGDDEVSAPMVGGDYVFRACADYEQVVPETDESNNCSAELPVTIIAPPPPAACVILNPLASLPATGSFDLAATSIEFPDVIQQGDEMHPKAQVCGVSGTSPRTRATWAYANCDGTGFTAFDGDTDDGLSAGECVTEENKEGDDLANIPPGRYVMYFIANGETQVPESDHSNNVQAKEFVVE